MAAPITVDTLKDNRYDKSVTGAGHGEVWAKDDDNYFLNTNHNQIITKAISVAVSGTLIITMADGIDVTTYLAAGIIHPIHAKRVKTGGTATTVTIWW